MGSIENRLNQQEEDSRSRIINDAEMVKKGAEVTPEGKILPSEKQRKTAEVEMNADLAGENLDLKRDLFRPWYEKKFVGDWSPPAKDKSLLLKIGGLIDSQFGGLDGDQMLRLKLAFRNMNSKEGKEKWIKEVEWLNERINNIVLSDEDREDLGTFSPLEFYFSSEKEFNDYLKEYRDKSY